MDALSEVNDTFALYLLKILCEDNASLNVFFFSSEHPLSTGSSLSETERKHCCPDVPGVFLNTEKDIHVVFQSLLAEGNKPGTQYLLRSASRLFVEKTCEFLSAELEQLSLAKAAEKSRKHISTWVSEVTGEGPKAGADDVPVTYIEEVKAQTLELPYVSEELSTLILLPDHSVDLSLMGKELTFEKFIAWTNLHHMMCTEVEVFLPRFKLEEHYNMESVLQRLEIVDAFQVGKANFLAMSSEEDLCLPKFVHKAFVEVYEDSTEATAASHMEASDCCLENAPRFCTDHPFLFFIRHNKANCILFCGKFPSP